MSCVIWIGFYSLMSKKNKVLIANGVNLDLLGKREESYYGDFTLKEMEEKIRFFANQKFFEKFEITFFQSNVISEYMEILSSENWDFMILNPGAWTHYAWDLFDRLKALKKPFIEVHMSCISNREEWRQTSVISSLAQGRIEGFKVSSYKLALLAIDEFIS